VATTIVEERLPEHAAAMGARLAAGLQAQVGKGAAKGVRGRGLLVALELDREAAPVVDACRDGGLLVNAVQSKTLRFAPPLIVQPDEIDQALAILDRVLAAPASKAAVGGATQSR
jgi:acetylornithine/succinyldiaminopimelate/putrescine aminotransferase